ncbi:hypothetical protein G9A89_018516 [Geosiphon pyriformis]|nr:hypothetical protein G9A89_018516 [Geosiphon pyriformis]
MSNTTMSESSTDDTGYDVKALAFGKNNHLLPLLIIGSIAFGSIIVHSILHIILKRFAKMSAFQFDNEIVDLCYAPTLILFPVGSILLTLQFITNVHPSILEPIQHAFLIILIAASTWCAINAVKAGSHALSRDDGFSKETADMQSKRLSTQLVVTTRILYAIIFVLGVSGIIFTFPNAKEFGTALLASASVASLFLGLATKPSMENLVASLQIALTQPLLLEDIVKFDGEQGTVQEIQAQYIVLKTSDERNMIIPLSRVIGGTFENLTRNGGAITASFDIYVDYGIPLEDLRKQFMEDLQKSEQWDHRNASLDIFEAKENALQLRAKMTANNLKDGNKLKVLMREKLINYLVVNFPAYLPHARMEKVPTRSGDDNMTRLIARMGDPILHEITPEYPEKIQ